MLLVQAADGDEGGIHVRTGRGGHPAVPRAPAPVPPRVAQSRQAAVPLVAIEDPGLVNHARSLESAPGVHFVAQPSNISLNASEGGFVAASGGGGGGGGRRLAQLPRRCPRISPPPAP